MSENSTEAAVSAWKRGFQPIPVITRDKKPSVGGWTRLTIDTEQEVRDQFTIWATEGNGNVGILLGAPSGDLVDVDIDHPKAARLKQYFLPPTPAKSGRPGRASSHYWYICEPGTLPGSTRQHLMPGDNGKRGAVAVELRSTLGQTVIPPSIHPSGEAYAWDGEPWGGAAGPARVNGHALAARVAMMGLGAVLLDNWPQKGTRHEAYLALAGGLLAYGDMGVHPFWGDRANAAEQLIRALAEATLDDDGPDSRVQESIGTTMKAIRAGHNVVGFGKLGEILGDDHIKQVRILVAEVESAAGFVSRQATAVSLPSGPVTHADNPAAATPSSGAGDRGAAEARQSEIDATPMEDRDPLGERITSWAPVDLGPYLSGQVKQVVPAVLERDDGEYLMYPGRVNMLFGSSESAKSWIVLFVCLQIMATGQRVLFIDFEDEPVNTLERLKALGATNDDIQKRFTYIRPEDPISAMQRDRWGKNVSSPAGLENLSIFNQVVEGVDPALIVADGMSVIYGLHGLNTNDTVETDVITSWLKSLTRNGRSTVIVIDHTGKGAEKGAMPIGSQHKVSMVQGTLLQAWPIAQPMPGAVGKIDLVVMKDRPGQVRKISQSSGGAKAQVAARVTMDSTVLGVTAMTVSNPPDPMLSANQPDLTKSKAAEKADRIRENREKFKERIIAVFGNDDTVKLSMRDIALRLPEHFMVVGSKVGPAPSVQFVKALTTGNFKTDGDVPTVLAREGTSKNTRYSLMARDLDRDVVGPAPVIDQDSPDYDQD